MGRETKLLLGFLGLLAGAFVGVLAMKLFVPRPPAGAGPDINTDPAFAERHDLVEPPTPAPRAWDFAAAPPLAPAAAPRSPAAAPRPPAAQPERPAAAAFAADGRYADRPAARFGSVEPLAADRADLRERPQPAITRVAWETPPTAVPDAATAGSNPPEFAVQVPEPPGRPTVAVAAPVAVRPSVSPPDARPPATPGDPAGYVVRPGDSWWAVAAAAYGDGRLYRALFAWNRAVDPRVDLAPGTRLEIPPLSRLAAAWPRLLPAPGSREP